MLYRLIRPMRRSGSRNLQFVQRIPSDLIGHTGGLKLSIPLGLDEHHHLALSSLAKDVRFSLRTHDPSLAKVRQASAAAFLEQVWAALRATAPASLSHRQATALAGELYRSWAAGAEREQTISIIVTRDGWEPDRDGPSQEENEAAFFNEMTRLRELTDGLAPEALEPIVGRLVDRLLLRRGIAKTDQKSRSLLLTAFAKALVDAFDARRRNAAGDYSPDPQSERFPTWQPLSKSGEHVAPAVSLTSLVESWWQEAQATGRKPSTHESYSKTMAAFVAFVGHNDAKRVTAEDVIRFKDHRLTVIVKRTGKRVSAKTVRDSDLAGLKTIFGWAVSNRKMRRNAASGVTIKLGKVRKLRSKGFTDEEAGTILRGALEYVPSRHEERRTAAAKRWVPWLCAYTGARVGELAQMRKQDLRQESGLWILRITPEAGTVKTDEARDVVLHEHLIDQGFQQFVDDAPTGHLFLKVTVGGAVRGPLRGLKNRLAEFARTLVPDPHVAPNHAWRHRFKTVGMEAGIHPRILDAIQGHAPRATTETYGDVTLRLQAAELRKMPRIEPPQG